MHEKQTILLVDDSENDIFLMRRAFKKAGVDSSLQEVHNGEEAIAYLAGEGIYHDRIPHPLPALVLLDLNMPMKDGFEVLRWARTQTAFKHLPIIVMTASIRREDVERASELGAGSYLVKPGSIDALVSMIRCLGEWTQINHFPPNNNLVMR